MIADATLPEPVISRDEAFDRARGLRRLAD